MYECKRVAPDGQGRGAECGRQVGRGSNIQGFEKEFEGGAPAGLQHVRAAAVT